MTAMKTVLALMMLAPMQAHLTVDRASGAASLKAAYAAQEESGSAAKVTPVQKVIELLQGMLEKGKKRKT